MGVRGGGKGLGSVGAGMYRGPGTCVMPGLVDEARRVRAGAGKTRMFEAIEVVLPMGV